MVPREARLRLLVADYASEELMRTTGWVDAMVAAVQGACKRLGPVRTADAIAAIHTSDPAVVAEIMLTYYDHLYDKHVASATGTGGGRGARECPIVDAALPPEHCGPESSPWHQLASQVLAALPT